MKHWGRVALAAAPAFALIGGTDARSATVQWELSAEPETEIGVVAGDPEYELFDAASSLLLSDGRIVVANAGSRQIRYFAPDGVFLKQVGGAGGGPGEFRDLRRLYADEGDTVLALDAAGRRLAVFDPDGSYVRVAARDAAADSLRPFYGWAFRSFWIEWTPRRAARTRVARALSRLPIPVRDAYRRVRPADSGDVWVREPVHPGDATARWTVLDAEGAPRAMLNVPGRFEIHDIKYPFVLGRWRDEMEVNFIRVYRLRRTDRPARVPEWYSSPGQTHAALEPQHREALQEVLIRIVTAQERYFADHGRYATNIAELDVAFPSEVSVDLISAGRRGWVAILVHRDAPVICGMGVGADTPPAWTEAVLECSDAIEELR